MSSIPRRTNAAQAQIAQAAQHREALCLATQLTPLQRQLVARAGIARWLQLPAPWLPSVGRQVAAAKALASSEFQVLEPVLDYLGAYRLTPIDNFIALPTPVLDDRAPEATGWSSASRLA